ncbi:terpene synthase family protein [Streptomyces sp. NPDC005876]|uniref:terpene synthase family protein n=1 Tax=unclassified Streptomyces TaxID=2593676 RepID=UPI0033E95EFD
MRLRLLADLRRWATRHPVVGAVPLEALAITAAAISPWRPAPELCPAAPMCAWTFALDDHVEQTVSGLAELDDLFGRCATIVRTGTADDSHPLLTALSAWQAELSRQPGYPALAGLWTEKFAKALDGMRYDWTTGRARENGSAAPDAAEYLRHADSVLVWITHMPRWITTDRSTLLDHLPLLGAALDHVMVAVRLANDLATYSWERAQPGQNNILMYDVTAEQVRAAIASASEAARRTLAPLLARSCPPAHEILRLLDWSVAFYAVADFRGWGSDVPLRPVPSPPGHDRASGPGSAPREPSRQRRSTRSRGAGRRPFTRQCPSVVLVTSRHDTPRHAMSAARCSRRRSGRVRNGLPASCWVNSAAFM